MKLLLLALLMASCASNKDKVEVEERVDITPRKIDVFNGKVKFVKFPLYQKDGKLSLECETDNDKNFALPGVVKKNRFSAYVANGYFSKGKSFECSYDGETYIEATLKQYPYKAEKLNVDKRRVFLNKKDLNRVIKERVIKANIYKKTEPDFMFDKEFKVPLESFITSHYGNKRLFNNKKQSQHLGNDFRARVGVPIPTTNRGRVVFVGDLFYTGKAVVIDHGVGIFSVYGHLSKIHVSKGDIVNRGDIIGLSGRTGRVSGPHLHWGVKINGHWVDGFSLINESKKQFQ